MGVLKKVLMIAAGILVIYLLFSLFMAWFITKIIFDTPKAFAPNKEKVFEELHNLLNYDTGNYEKWEKRDFIVKNGSHEIVGEYYPIENHKGVAVVAHGFGKNRYIMVPHANILRDLGFTTIVYDQRGFGVNRGKGGCTFGIKEGEDCAKVIDWARKTFGADTKIVLCGASMGAMSVLNSQMYTNPVDAIIEDSSPDHVKDVLKPFYSVLVPLPNPFLKMVIRKSRNLGYDMKQCNPIDAARNIKILVLIMHGEADRTVPVQMGKNIMGVLQNKKSRIEIFAGKDHTLEIKEYDRYKKIVTEFIEDVM